MMRNPEKNFALLYFENQSVLPEISGFNPGKSYSLQWFDTVKGEWKEPVMVITDKKGSLVIPFFPDRKNPSGTDWALKIKQT